MEALLEGFEPRYELEMSLNNSAATWFDTLFLAQPAYHPLLDLSADDSAAEYDHFLKLNEAGVWSLETLFSSDLLGWFGLSLGLIFSLILAVKRPVLAYVLVAAFSVRAATALFHYYAFPLPDGIADAVRFELDAWSLATDHKHGSYLNYPGINSRFFPWCLSLIYLLTGRSILLLQALSVFVGVLSVYAMWSLTSELWGRREGIIAAWLLAVFPTVVMYSALPMREPYLILCLLLGLTWVGRWVRTKKGKPLVWAVLYFVIGAHFHSSMWLVILAFSSLVVFRAWYLRFGSKQATRVSRVAIAGLIIGSLSIAAFIISDVQVDKFGKLEELIKVERLIQYAAEKQHSDGHVAGSAYPDWTIPKTGSDLVWVLPVKTLYLLFSPFPWDVRTLTHFIGVFDGLLYLILIAAVVRGSRKISQNPSAIAIALVVVPYMVAYGFGTSNFGTALRHRTKILSVIIALSSPIILRLILCCKWRILRPKTGVARGPLALQRAHAE
tara:strand:- start:316 stop:1809 length:1494 start_codon:yes stop_codon:yes gene_type:complete